MMHDELLRRIADFGRRVEIGGDMLHQLADAHARKVKDPAVADWLRDSTAPRRLRRTLAAIRARIGAGDAEGAKGELAQLAAEIEHITKLIAVPLVEIAIKVRSGKKGPKPKDTRDVAMAREFLRRREHTAGRMTDSALKAEVGRASAFRLSRSTAIRAIDRGLKILSEETV